MRSELLTPRFQANLKAQGYPVEDILSDITENPKLGPFRVIRNWTKLPDSMIREGVFNKDRDVVLPVVYAAILDKLKPWIDADIDEGLPTITIKEISRITSLSAEKVVRVLSRYPLSLAVNGSNFITAIQKPEFPEDRLILRDSRVYGLTPARVAKAARYQSRSPGGGPVQRARLQDKNINTVIRTKAWEELEIQFVNEIAHEETSGYGVMQALEVPVQESKRTVEEIIYAEPEGAKIWQVFQWFNEVGFGKNWVYRGNEVGFAENLVKLSRGKPVDFLIWNCIGFKWFEDITGNMPTCNISNNLDAAITLFFQQRIQEVAETLSTIGNPNITILIPSNEAFDNRVWRYRQSPEERESIITRAVTGLSDAFQALPLPPNVTIDVRRWDDYLASRDVSTKPEEYSQAGEERLRQSDGFSKIMREAVESGRGYFGGNGIRRIKDEVLAARQIMYYGVYAGEGVAFEELQSRERGIVIVNFEEMRVPQMAFLGAMGNLCVVTPITQDQMINYYRWETKQISKRI